LNDIVEPFSDEDTFSIVFTVGKISPNIANGQLAGMTELRTAISPFLKIQEGQNCIPVQSKIRGQTNK